MANSGRIELILLLALMGTVVIALAQPIAGSGWDQGNTTSRGNTPNPSGIIVQGNATIIPVQSNATIIINTVQPQTVAGKDNAKDSGSDSSKSDSSKSDESDDDESC